MKIPETKMFCILILLGAVGLFQYTPAAAGNMQNTDSLWKVYRDPSKADTLRLEAISRISWGYKSNNPDSAILLANEQLREAEQKHLKVWIASALNTIAAASDNKGDYPKALEYYTRCLKLREELGIKKAIATTLNNLGLVYANLSDFPKALDYHLRSLKIKEELKDIKGTGNSLSNIGSIYVSLGDYKRGLDYHLKALKNQQAAGNQQGIANALSNIGMTYFQLNDDVHALDFCMQSLKLRETLGDKRGIAISLGNIGNVYQEQKLYAQAADAYKRCLELDQEIGNREGEALALRYCGDVYRKEKKFREAISSYDKGAAIAREIHNLDVNRELEEATYYCYREMKDSPKALEHFEKYILLRDSIFKEDNKKEITRRAIQYEYDKKSARDSVKNSEEKKVQDALIAVQNSKIRQEQTQRYALYAGLTLVLIFSGFVYNRFLVTRKQKGIIEVQKQEVERQKELVEEHRKDMIDSITYARRLQEAILPPQNLLGAVFRDFFLLYKPKDIVAGDFYWMERAGEVALIAAADCTGHGVPGAMVSVVCSNALNRTVKEFGISEPGKILDKVRELVIETFEKSESEVKDGMDISLCSVNCKTGEVKWAGANNPLWYMRKGKMQEITASKQPIGKVEKPSDFMTHTFSLEPEDMLYLFTDGYADQFGGPKGKKFKYKQLAELLTANHALPLQDQKTALSKALQDWKQGLEQVDDILIIGIRI